MVVGVGGVGSWAVEALARHGVGQLFLVDLDNVAESNINRQLQALEATLGMAKVDALAERVASINPSCSVVRIEDFVTPENVAGMFGLRPGAILDCTDQTAAKVAMAACSQAQRIPLFMAGAAGGRVDPTRIRCADLGEAQGDALLARVRSLLRKAEGFRFERKGCFGITAVYSPETMRKPLIEACDTSASPQGLNCAGYGSSVCVTAGFGFALAAAAIERLLSLSR
jgi:tRNA A37 threonylcarbamoyladenosine dehydratase